MLFYSAKQLLQWHPGVLYLMFHRRSLLSQWVKRYFLTAGHTDQQTVHKQRLALTSIAVSDSVMYYSNSTFLHTFLFFFLSLPPLYFPFCRYIDTNDDSNWSCALLTEHCDKKRKKLPLPIGDENPSSWIALPMFPSQAQQSTGCLG